MEKITRTAHELKTYKLELHTRTETGEWKLLGYFRTYKAAREGASGPPGSKFRIWSEAEVKQSWEI
jgi:hypothetical protein